MRQAAAGAPAASIAREARRTESRPRRRSGGSRARPTLPLDRRRDATDSAAGKRPRPESRSRRRRSRKRACRRRATPNSTARATRPCARSIGSTPGSRARAISAWSPSTSQTTQHRPDAGDALRLLARGRAERGLLRAAGAPPRRRGRQCGSLFAGEHRARPDFRRATRSRRSSRCSRTRACSRSGRTSSSTGRCFALRGIEIAPYDDTMLMSYVLDAGRSSHGLDALAERYFDHAAIDLNALIGSGKTRITLRLRRDRARPPNTRPRRRHGAAALARAQAARSPPSA